MAALSSRAVPLQQLTPPSSSHGAGGSWDFAVPVNHSRDSYEHDHHASEFLPYTNGPRQPLASQPNGFAKPVRSPTWESQDHYRDNIQAQLVPDHVNELHKKKSGDMIPSSTDQDSVLEYYKSHNKQKAPTAAKGKVKKKTTNTDQPEPEVDSNNWIHRDKLKEIETRELEEAGFRVGRSSRSNSRSQSATRRARDRTNSASTERIPNGEERGEPRKVISPIPAEDEEAVEGYHAWSPTSPETVTTEFQPTQPRANHSVRPSTSRIPLPKTSGIPVPAAVAERDAPLPRSRAGSTNWGADAIAINGARVRSGSVGSQVLLDDHEDGRQRTPPYGGHRRNQSSSGSFTPPKSPMKAKVPGKPTPASGARKVSAQKMPPPKPRVTSGNSPTKRPGTSSKSVTRPTTANRPEGEAPWIATMYKPDPRLPPDQQIIPTHAKRMQQEQWEDQGRVGSMYDKDFGLLNTDDMTNKRLSQLANLDPIKIEKAREDEAWPLPSPVKQEEAPLEKVDTNTAKSEQGAYKLTPTIPQRAPSQRAPSPKMAPPIAPPEPKPTVTRVPEPEEEPKEEKKGRCCIVM